MTVGSLIRYRVNPEDPPAPGIVMRIWPDAKVELYVFHFEAAAHIRAAHPSQIEDVFQLLDEQITASLPPLLAKVMRMEDRILWLENQVRNINMPVAQIDHNPETDGDLSILPPINELENEGEIPEIADAQVVDSTSPRRGKRPGAWPR
jgi:hypothetical protein